MEPLNQKPTFGGTNPALHEDHDSAWGELFYWILGSAIFFAAIYFAAGFFVDIFAQKISDQDERKWFSKIQSTLLSNLDVSETVPSTPENMRSKFATAQGLLDKMLATQKTRALNYQLHYSQSKEPNAFALPGGAITLTQGLLTSLETDMGLAMVIAHELGHHQHRDALKSMGRRIFLALTVSVIFGGQSSLISFATNFAEASNSREQETAADAYGIKLIYSTFRDTRDSLEFFENLAKNNNSQLEKYASMFSSHPYSKDRYDHLKSMEQQLLKAEK